MRTRKRNKKSATQSSRTGKVKSRAPDRRKAMDASKSIERLKTQLKEVREQHTAASEVLKIISVSLGEVEPAFHAMLSNAMRICDAKFGILYEFRNGQFRAISSMGVPPAYAEFVQQR